MSLSKCVQEVVKNVKNCLQEKEPGRPWLKRIPTPFSKDYRPEVDLSPELRPKDASSNMSQIGVLRWMVKIGRVHIITEVSMLASQLARPRDGHLEAIYRIYAYLDNKHNSRMDFDCQFSEVGVPRETRPTWSSEGRVGDGIVRL